MDPKINLYNIHKVCIVKHAADTSYMKHQLRYGGNKVNILKTKTKTKTK